ncbi:hypothetical protein [Microcella flavibacter]|uniref:hypothetical protein n=1 Tax=Microcella flavibacter TaxID=1804990 RepID=UPI0014566595|nr:hypothetical protein [Microcella flavibacter]
MAALSLMLGAWSTVPTAALAAPASDTAAALEYEATLSALSSLGITDQSTASRAGTQGDVPEVVASSAQIAESDGALRVDSGTGTVSITPSAPEGTLNRAGDLAVFSAEAGYDLVTAAIDGRPAAYAVMHDNTAPSRFAFDVAVDGQPAALQAVGDAIQILDPSGNVLNAIAPPWAVDANGEPVPTRYEVVGSSIIQVVDHVGFEYPVVADPRVACDAIFCTLEFTWAETFTASETALAAGTVLCGGATLLAPIPGVVFACSAYAVAFWVTAVQAKNQYDCVAMRINRVAPNLTPPFPVIYGDESPYCNPPRA